ncbi:polyisoprenoid-binding protein [Paraburkholderia caffeinilytica]|uniref:Polyisoprenoid-binding protein n=1 Tax=Paraburkholderia caffeinilytica TaxID=1761016 RepID=A0ABQ1LTQ0_9BURK|nr:YceI family protein [Paraburkholderia caffeinilytica]AXL53716.1 polyisoprenoid-binding protein [Paraburkholderia caffeinilytica]GGC26562.1 polyisoprenoid-binding protein [Paraburkholderia caffeinilytica]CAB3779759.1 Protein YceI [Paraburkholderia caffeinilytica]
MLKALLPHIAVATCCGVGSVAAQAHVDIARSSVTATLTQMNVPVDGRFRRFDANIAFDPAHPEAAAASIDVNTASYDLGDDSFNSEARNKEWFESAVYPRATFRSTSVKGAGKNAVDVAGQLTVKGAMVNVVVRVTFSHQGNDEVFDGTLPIRRSQFKLGTGEWADSSVVSDTVKVQFHIVNTSQ